LASTTTAPIRHQKVAEAAADEDEAGVRLCDSGYVFDSEANTCVDLDECERC
jgi:hypothetical protein